MYLAVLIFFFALTFTQSNVSMAITYEFSVHDLASYKTLSCSINLSSVGVVMWKKMNDKGEFIKLSDIHGSTKYTQLPNNSLKISKPNGEDLGEYLAEYNNTNDNRENCTLIYHASPLVLNITNPGKLKFGDTLVLNCSVISYPKTPLTWYKNGTKISPNNRISLGAFRNYPNASLTVKSLASNDSATYNCTICASGGTGNCSTAGARVAVGDAPLAAPLWPFLCVVGWVTLLCAIIFLYERRQSKQADRIEREAEAAEAAEAVEGRDDANTDGDAGLRLRGGVKN